MLGIEKAQRTQSFENRRRFSLFDLSVFSKNNMNKSLFVICLLNSFNIHN